MAKKEKKQTITVKKKNWYPILAPKMFNNMVIGETHVGEPSLMNNKHISVNLMSLTNDFKKQDITLKLKVVEVKDNKAYTTVVGYVMSAASIKRMVRREKSRVDYSFSCLTKDNKTVTLKPFLLTRTLAYKSILTKLRKTIIRTLASAVKAMNYEELVNALVTRKLQNGLRSKSSKIFPLRACEIRLMKLEPEGKKIRLIEVKEAKPLEERPKPKKNAAEPEKEESKAASEIKPKEEAKQEASPKEEKK